MIKYIGSKRTLVPVILEAVRRAANAHSVIDLFSGTSRVGHALKAAGYRVLSNDHNAYAATLARCYVQADAEDVIEDARKLVREFNLMTLVRTSLSGPTSPTPSAFDPASSSPRMALVSMRSARQSLRRGSPSNSKP